ncbi:MAG: Nif3-like dinuclear metal center hexameric protein [Tissierellia bacterium]|nr:Nif3-like dinuclear metal center hexameric protein [Tissierellia bacterium]
MLIREFIAEFEKKIPLDLQDDWDNSGWQLGDKDRELRQVLLCVDVTEDVIDQAIEFGANLIIAHHPILFRPTKSIDMDFFISKKLIKAIKNDISIYACHTAIDVHESGLNSFVFKKMGFKSQDKLIYTLDNHGYGNLASFPSRKAWDLVDQIKERLDLDHVIFYGDEDRQVAKVCLVTGAGSSFINQCLEAGVDMFITADVGHHTAMDALEQGMLVVDLGHYQSERFFNELLEELIKKIDPEIKTKMEIEGDKYLRKIL